MHSHRHLAFFLLATFAVACASDPTSSRESSTASSALTRIEPLIDAPTVTGPIPGDAFVVSTALGVDIADYGYVQEEYFFSGTATAYKATGPHTLDGKWPAAPDTKAPYTTRMVVMRPKDPAKFNGTALVEWVNTTGLLDAQIAFSFAWEEIMREGYAYVGVSAQQSGVQIAQLVAPDRYGQLDHPGDLYVYDIFAQAGVAVGWPKGLSPLGELKVERTIAYGMSQSAMRMITMANAIHPLTKPFDSYYIHSRAGWGAPIGDESGGPLGALLGDGKPVQVRDDLEVPVFQYFSESEVILFLGPGWQARQPDTDKVVTWEVAGTAHIDQRTLFGLPLDLACGGATINNGPGNVVVKAGLRWVQRWLTEGVPPPSATPLQLLPDKSELARDEKGIAIGGVRTPAVDVPIAVNTGDAINGNPACLLFGASAPFSEQKLRSLYPTHEDYVSKVEAAVADAIDKGFVLPEEEASIIAEAERAKVP